MQKYTMATTGSLRLCPCIRAHTGHELIY